jgi:hypothetical protein
VDIALRVDACATVVDCAELDTRHGPAIARDGCGHRTHTLTPASLRVHSCGVDAAAGALYTFAG